jgi:hypothetical protein
LLDSVLPTIDGPEAEVAAATMNKDALLSFLNILSEIEQVRSSIPRHHAQTAESQGLIDDYSSAQIPNT